MGGLDFITKVPNKIEYILDDVIKMELMQNQYCYFNSWHYEKLKNYKWRAYRHRNTFYASTSLLDILGKRKVKKMHKLITNTNNEIIIDHKDGNGLNNIDSNLRNASKFENARNRTRSKYNTSGYKNIGWRKDIEKWRVRITLGNKNIYSDNFEKIEDALKVRNEKLKELHGEFARYD